MGSKTATPEIEATAAVGDMVTYVGSDSKERAAIVTATPASRPDLTLGENQVRLLVLGASGRVWARTATFDESTGCWTRALATVYSMNGGADYPHDHAGPTDVDSDGSGLSDL